MSSDSRRTGGVANYEWQRGTRAEPAPPDLDVIKVHVKRYLADCRRFSLDRRYHPTEEGVLKIVHHQGDRQKQAILAVFRQAVTRG